MTGRTVNLLRFGALAVAGLCAGCAAWPPVGHGGMAEKNWPPVANPEIPVAAPPPDLKRHLSCTLDRLADLDRGAAQIGTRTGKVALLDLDGNRARREFAGGFYSDAANTVAKLDRDIDSLGAEMRLPMNAAAECA